MCHSQVFVCLSGRHWFSVGLELEAGASRMAEIESQKPGQVGNFRNSLWSCDKHGVSVPLMAQRNLPIPHLED